MIGGGDFLASILGAAFGAVLDWLNTDCDGVAAAATYTYDKDRDLQDQIVLHGAQEKYTGSTYFLSSSQSGGPLCSSSSNHTVFSTIAEFKFPS